MTIKQALIILGARGSDLTITDITRVYRAQLFKWHPDFHMGKESLDDAIKKTKEINLAYELISELAETNTLILSCHSETSRERTIKRTYQNHRYTPGFPDSSVPEIFFKSSHIVSCGYNSILNVLYIKFTKDVVYRYYSVPKTVFDQFLAAESHGKFAHRHIYLCFKYERCTEPNVPYSGPSLNPSAMSIRW